MSETTRSAWRAILLGPLAALLLASAVCAARADGIDAGRPTGDPAACEEQAIAYADAGPSPSELAESAARGGIEGAVYGGFTGRGRWDPRNAEKEARAGGALGVFDTLNNDDWQKRYDAAYEACLAGRPLATDGAGIDCPSTATVTSGAPSGSSRGKYSASSRLPGECR
ncbi:hypothetical protein H2509_04630 [Stappia sp. F7233]|uniref:Uncharacterized protein n=1 Tax=Stappia albiluteola TaxID=2758565 RepID=A0A839A9U1_9HYPH|nr:hypothetical protein [Stappia albiluteola]MBA5776410.1 hypothetical protein [Stappia albiluteola]